MEKEVKQLGIGKSRNPDWAASTKRVGMGSQPIKPLKFASFSPSARPNSPAKPKAEPVNLENQSGRAIAEAFLERDAEAPMQSAITEPSLTEPWQVASRKIEPEALVEPLGLAQESVTDPNPFANSAILRRAATKLKRKQWGWSVVWISALCIFGGMGTSAFLWLAGLPPLPNCKSVTALSPDMHRLYCAQEIVRSGQLSDLLSGMSLLENWSPDRPFYSEVQQSIADWSALVLIIAREKMAQSDLKGAVEAASQIPPSSSVYKEAQAAIAHWQAQWQRGEEIYAKAMTAIQAQNWKEASYLVADLGDIDHDYWRLQKADALSQQIVVERQARDFLTQARKLAKSGEPDQMGEAIALVQRVAPQTRVWKEAQTALVQWSQTLIQTGLQQWAKGDVTGAIAIAQQIPPGLSLPTQARDLVQFSHAAQLVDESNDSQWQPTWGQLWNLLEAVSAVDQIAPASPVFSQAQANTQRWQMQLQDLIQLHFANFVAELGQRPNLEFAIAQANRILPDSPRRLQAQTLAAHWTEEIERVEDRPYLIRAEEMAKSGKVPDLKLAIAQASQIPQDRAAWTEAQTLVDQWNRQVETIEDQPILNQASVLAKQKQLEEAIQVAEKIQPGRALYERAQAAIDQWQTAIRDAEIAEDQPTMDQANALAARDRLTMAIELASQIAPGRSLYNEAQSSIKIWQDQRDQIWNSQPTQSSPQPVTDAAPNDAAPNNPATPSDALTPTDSESNQPAAPEAASTGSADQQPAPADSP